MARSTKLRRPGQLRSAVAKLTALAGHWLRAKGAGVRVLRTLAWLLVIAQCALVAVLTVSRSTLYGLNTNMLIVVAAVTGLLAFWFLIIPISARLGLGPVVLVERANAACREMDEDELRRSLVVKLGSQRDICSTFASLSVSIIGIVMAVAVLAPQADAYIRGVLLTATFLLMVATLTLIHAVDLSDTALSPGVDLDTIMSARVVTGRYYTNGLILLIFAMLAGMSVLSPYLTVACTVAYVLIVSHHFFVWDEIQR